MEIRDIMTQPVKTISVTATVEQAAGMMAIHDVGALPVCEGDRLVGIVTDRDIVLRCIPAGFNPATTRVSRIMSRDPVGAPPSAPVKEAWRLLADLRIHRRPIVEDGRVVGMLTTDDIARRFDDDAAVLFMVRRVAPRRRSRAA